MGFASLALHNFRSYSRFAVALSPGVNIVVGPNGSGKTNLLEALYVLSVGGTFRGSDKDMVAHGSDWFRLESIWEDQKRIVTYRLRPGQTAEKQFSIDESKKARLTHGQRIPLVLFEPDHLRLLKDSPGARRDYLDGLLTGLQSDYSWLKHQFERVLLQRNNLLKRHLSPSVLDDSLFAWDIKFAELAQTVVQRRLGLIGLFDERLSDIYSSIAGKKSSIQISYVSSVPQSDYQAQALKLLRIRRSQDEIRGFTTIGPQRDDFVLLLNGVPAEASASRGEMRSLLLAIKMVELELVDAQNSHSPILLLDDVFSELDSSRRSALAEVASGYQTIITTTDVDDTVGGLFSDYNRISTKG